MITFTASIKPEELFFTVIIEAEIDQCLNVFEQIPEKLTIELSIDNELEKSEQIPPFDSLSSEDAEACASYFVMEFEDISYSQSDDISCQCEVFLNPYDAMIDVFASSTSPETQVTTTFKISFRD